MVTAVWRAQTVYVQWMNEMGVTGGVALCCREATR